MTEHEDSTNGHLKQFWATWLVGLALVLLVGFLYWAERQYPRPSKPREWSSA